MYNDVCYDFQVTCDSLTICSVHGVFMSKYGLIMWWIGERYRGRNALFGHGNRESDPWLTCTEEWPSARWLARVLACLQVRWLRLVQL